MIDLSRIEVEAVIVHDIPRRARRADRERGEDTEPTLSDRPSDLDNRLRRYFEERLTSSLSNEGYPVQFDPETESATPSLITGFLDGTDDDLVRVSRAMASYLHDSQTWQSGEGLFAVISGSIAGRRFIAPMKLERERGLVVEAVGEQGQMTFQIVLEDDLVMTDRTKVFKAGLFQIDPEDPDESVEGLVSDHQTGFRATRAVALFFLEKFLGCRLLDQPELSTQKYFDAVEKWINREIEDAEKRTRYEQALITTMNDQATRISPTRFRDAHLNVEDRASYDVALEDADVPAHAFPKDTQLIQRLIRRVQFDTAGGARALVPTEMLDDERARIAPAEGGRSTITITDEVRRVQGG